MILPLTPRTIRFGGASSSSHKNDINRHYQESCIIAVKVTMWALKKMTKIAGKVTMWVLNCSGEELHGQCLTRINSCFKEALTIDSMKVASLKSVHFIPFL